MQNFGKDICLKIDEAVEDTIHFLLSVTQSNINQTAFKLIRQITCKRKNKVKGTLHGKSLELMKEPSDVPVLVPYKSADVFDVWKSLAPTTALARRNFRSSLLEIIDHDIVVVLDTTKPSTAPKYPISKPTYGSQRLNIDLSEVALKITLLPSTAPKEASDDSLYLNDRYLTTEINKEYNKIMHIETIFNSPNRIINFVNCEDSDKAQEAVAPEEKMEHSSVTCEDVVTFNPTATQLDPVNELNKSPSFIMDERNNNTPSVVNPLEISHKFSSIDDRSNDTNEHYLLSLGNSDLIDSGIDTINNSIVSKNSLNLNFDEIKAGFDFPLRPAFRNDDDIILIGDSNFKCISKGGNNPSVREFIFSNSYTDQSVSTNSFRQLSNTVNGQLDDEEFICNNNQNVYMGASYTNDSSESLSISLNCTNSVVAGDSSILNGEQLFLETDIVQKINEVQYSSPEFMHVEELFSSDELPQIDQLVPSQPLLIVEPFDCSTNGNCLQPTGVCVGPDGLEYSLSLKSGNCEINTNDDVPLLVDINSNISKIINSSISSEITPENNIQESNVDLNVSSLMEIDVNQGLPMSDMIESSQLESSSILPIPFKPQMVRVLLVDFIKYPSHFDLSKYILLDARKDLFTETDVLSNNTEASNLPLSSVPEITNQDLFIETEAPFNNTEDFNLLLSSNTEISNKNLFVETEVSSNNTKASNLPLSSDHHEITNRDLFIVTEALPSNTEAFNLPLPSDLEVIETEASSNNTEASNILPLPSDHKMTNWDLFIETKVSSNNTETANLPLPFNSAITCSKIYNDPFTSLDFAKAKQTLSARQCSKNCANIFCAHKPGSHITSLDIDSQIRQGANSSSQKHIEPESDSGFIIFGGSNDQLSFLEEIGSKESKLPFKHKSTQNKQTASSSRSSNATVTKQQEKSKTGVKRSAEPDNSQNKRGNAEKKRKREKKPTKHTSCSNNKSRWPLYNFSKPADCFEAVENYWDGLPLPDPHENLTTRYHNTPPNYNSNFSIAGSDSRTIDCLYIYETQIEKVERKIRDIQYNIDQFSFNWTNRCLRKNLNELEKLKSVRTKLLSACEEAYRFYTYYRNRRTGWSAWHISEYQKNEMDHILRDTIQMYHSFYGAL